MTLLEVVVALAVLGIGVTALERLVVRSVATIGGDARLGRALAVAQGLLAEAELAPPEPGHSAGERSGARWERDVSRTPHPALREVRVRVYPDADAMPCELVELIRVPPG